MSAYKLNLTPDYGRSIELELTDQQKLVSSLNDLMPEQDYVYSDQLYSVTIKGLDINFKKLSLYINDYEVEQNVSPEGRILFSGSHYPKGRIFVHNFGLVQMSVRIDIDDCLHVTLYTKFIPILVINSRTNQSVQRMAEYIYYWRERLLLSGPLLSEQRQGLKPGAPKELETQIQILRDIVHIYSESISYFHTNAKFNLRPVGNIDNYEKVRFISSRMLTYVTQHPEQLTRTAVVTGIRQNNRYFLPRKTLIEENVIDYDIYENQIIVGFLNSLCSMIKELSNKISSRLAFFPDIKEIENGYFLSASFVFSSTRRKLEKAQENLLSLEQNIEELYHQYSQLLPVTKQVFDKIPPPTPIFISNRPYRLIYEQITRWFQFGIYNFSREDFILPMLQSDKLYEFYVLLKIYNYIVSNGFVIQKSDEYSYKSFKNSYPSIPSHSGIKCDNTFIFWNEDTLTELTLFYEPYVHNGNSRNVGENGVGLFRNMSYSFDGKESEVHYWPDYVIKIKKSKYCQYIILDAKFSTRQSVKEYQIRPLLFKYLISVSTIDPEDTILGLIVINGKSKELEDTTESIYNRVAISRKIHPFAKIVTLTENQENSGPLHEKLLNEIIHSFIL